MSHFSVEKSRKKLKVVHFFTSEFLNICSVYQYKVWQHYIHLVVYVKMTASNRARKVHSLLQDMHPRAVTHVNVTLCFILQWHWCQSFSICICNAYLYYGHQQLTKELNLVNFKNCYALHVLYLLQPNAQINLLILSRFPMHSNFLASDERQLKFIPAVSH